MRADARENQEDTLEFTVVQNKTEKAIELCISHVASSTNLVSSQ